MANTTDSRTIFNGNRKLRRVVIETYVDTAAPTITLADASDFTGPDGVNAVDYFAINKVKYDLSEGVSALIKFDATTDDEAVAVSGQGYFDFCSVGGLVDPQSTGTTGDVLATLAGMGAGDHATFDIELKKKQN